MSPASMTYIKNHVALPHPFAVAGLIRMASINNSNKVQTNMIIERSCLMFITMHYISSTRHDCVVDVPVISSHHMS